MRPCSKVGSRQSATQASAGQVHDAAVGQRVPGQPAEEDPQPVETDGGVGEQPAHHRIVVEAGRRDLGDPVGVVEGGGAHVGHARTVPGYEAPARSPTVSSTRSS